MSTLIKRNILWLLTSEICAKGIIFFAGLYLARVLGVSGFGQYSLALAVGIYLWTVVDMGVTSYGTREVARKKDSATELLSILNSIRFLIALLSLTVLLAAMFMLHVPLETAIVVVAGGSYVVAYALSPEWVMQGLERMEYLALSNGVVSISYLTLIFLFVRSSEDTVFAVLFRSLCFFLGSIISLVIIKEKFGVSFAFRFSIPEWWLHIRESFYFAISGAFNNIILYIPVFIVGALCSMEDVGFFSASHKTIILMTNAAAVIPMASYPTLSSLYKTDTSKFIKIHNSVQRIMIYFGVPLGIMVMFMSKKIIFLLYGKSYSHSSTILAIMSLFIPLMFLRLIYVTTLVSAGFHRSCTLAFGAGTAVAATAGVLLIRYYGTIGAAISMIAGESTILLFLMIILRRKVNIANPMDLFLIKVLCASLLTAIFAATADLGIIYSSVMSLCIYAILSLVFGVATLAEIKTMYMQAVARRFGHV